jgi:hypothetical protein
LSLALVSANKTYSAWSFWPGFLEPYLGIALNEIMILIAHNNTRAEMRAFLPLAKNIVALWQNRCIGRCRMARAGTPSVSRPAERYDNSRPPLSH